MRLLLRRPRRPSKPGCRIHKLAGLCAASAVSYPLCYHCAGPRLPRSLRPWRWTSRSWRGGGSGRNGSSSSTRASRYRLVSCLKPCNVHLTCYPLCTSSEFVGITLLPPGGEEDRAGQALQAAHPRGGRGQVSPINYDDLMGPVYDGMYNQ